MRRIIRMVGVVALAAATLLAAVGCKDPQLKNPYEVAEELGAEGSEAAWLSELTKDGTEARRMYEEAVLDGYPGSYLDFLKEIHQSGDTVSINEALMSTVSVFCGFVAPSIDQRPGASLYSSGGSGVIYSLEKDKGDAYVVTNYHVVYNASSAGLETVAHISDDIKLYLYGDNAKSFPIPAEYVGGSMDHDIAVLRVRSSEVLKESGARVAQAADSDAVTIGEPVYVIGNPNLSGMSVVSGILSVDAEYISVIRADNSKTVSLLEMRTDAPINHGNSGGGMYNAEGKLLAVVNARSELNGVEHFGYGIPVNLAYAIAQNIIDNSKINRSRGAICAMLGVTLRRSELHSAFDERTGKAYLCETVSVSEVTSGGAAANKLQVGDVIYSIRINKGEEKVVTRMHMVTNTLFDVRKGNTVTLLVSRAGRNPFAVEILYDRNEQFKLFS